VWAAIIRGVECISEPDHHCKIIMREKLGHEIDFFDTNSMLSGNTTAHPDAFIKLAAQEVGLGSERVREPRLPLSGEERDRILKIIHHGITNRPKLETKK
jgi:dihydrodipicolinate synthase/N-acetylneuraminate lyase